MTQRPWRQWLASDAHFVYLLEQDRLEGCLAMTPSESFMSGRQAVELLVWYITARLVTSDGAGNCWFTVFQGPEDWQVMT